MPSSFDPASRARPRRAVPCCALAGLVLVFLALLAPASASAAATIYYRGANTTQNGSGSSSLTLNAPANTAVGDLLILDADAVGTTAVTVPTGWTSLYNGTTDFNGSAFQGWAAVYYRVATAADVGASYTINLGSSRKATGRIASYVGVDTTTPVQTSATGGGNANGTTITYPSITTNVANERVVLDAGVFNSTGTFNITPPNGTADRGSVKTNGAGSVEGNDGADFLQATAGATGTKSGTISASSAWGAITIGLKPAASGVLQFATSPALPSSLPSLTLNGASQTINSTMSDFAVDDTTGSGSGWHVTVNGHSGSGFSSVFEQYCPSAGGCTNAGGGTDPQGYVTGGQTLAANSLTLTSSGASWSTTGGSGSAPTFSCSSGCTIDSSSATTIASAASGGAGAGPWSTSGFTGTSLALAAPTTLHAIPSTEVYRADLVWTLASGP